MKIAIVSKIHHPISSSFSGGIEVFNYNLCDGLVRKGHEVYLFAAKGSKTRARLYPISENGLFDGDISKIDPQMMRKLIYVENKAFIDAFRYIGRNNFDIVHHSHSEFLPVYLASLIKVPQLFTTHITVNTNTTLYSDIKSIFPKQKDVHLVSISKYQQKILKDLHFFKNIYNGIPLANFTFSEKPKDYISWLGRMVPNKGAVEAIKIAIKAKKKIKIAGGFEVGDVAQKYAATLKKYFSHPSVDYLGSVFSKDRRDLLSNSKVHLLPINWEEPFGLVMPEVMASGTPIIAFARGSVPEIIKDGETGFIVNYSENDKRGNFIIKETGIRGMIRAVKMIYEMSPDSYIKMRRNCRKHVEKNFTSETMVDNYSEAYKRIARR
jgi:glycosyltransferase involved in cell wall biosynthesis